MQCIVNKFKFFSTLKCYLQSLSVKTMKCAVREIVINWIDAVFTNYGFHKIRPN